MCCVLCEMLPPVRCFTCNSITRWREYDACLRKGQTPIEAMESMGRLSRYCCRRMLLTHPRTVTAVLARTTCNDMAYDDGSVMHLEARGTVRHIACD